MIDADKGRTRGEFRGFLWFSVFECLWRIYKGIRIRYVCGGEVMKLLFVASSLALHLAIQSI